MAFRSFISSWYGNIQVLMLLAAASSFLITFYTTALSVPWSITLTKHLLVFVFSFVLMFLAFLPIGYGVYRLDASSYLRQNELLRYLIQFILLVFLLGAIALRVVYAVYLVFFNVDLQQAEYFERDYVVVLFCLIMVQVYYVLRKDRKLRSFTLKRIEILKKWLSQRDEIILEYDKRVSLLQLQLGESNVEKTQIILHYEAELEKVREEKNHIVLQHETELEELHVERNKMIMHHRNELEELKARKQRLRRSHELMTVDEMRFKGCLQEISEQILVIIATGNEWVRISQVAYFYLKEGSSRSKLVDIKLLDGREGKVDFESLSKIEKLWPNLVFRAGRGLLVVHLAIRGLAKEDDAYVLEFYGVQQERHKVQADAYEKLFKLREQWTTLIPERADYS